jgi:hypothetical protein
MHMDNPDFAIPFPRIGAQLAVACQPSDAVPVKNGRSISFASLDFGFPRFCLEASRLKVWVSLRHLTAIKTFASPLQYRFRQRNEGCGRISDRPLQQGFCREQRRYPFFHRVRQKLWKLFLDSEL